MTRPSDWNALLRAELRTAKLDFTPRLGPSGRLSAGFRYAEAAGPALDYTARIRHGALKIQTSVPGTADLAVLPAFNALWGTGRIVADPERNLLQLDGGYPAFASRSGVPLIRVIAAELYAVGVALAPAAGGSWEEAAAAVTMARDAYPSLDPDSLHQTATALAASGYKFAAVGDAALRQSFQEPDGNGFMMDIVGGEDRFLLVRTSPASGMVHDPVQLNRLTASAPFGCFFSDESHRLKHVCALPGAWISIDPRLVLWLIELASQMSALSRPPARPPAQGVSPD